MTAVKSAHVISIRSSLFGTGFVNLSDDLVVSIMLNVTSKQLLL